MDKTYVSELDIILSNFRLSKKYIRSLREKFLNRNLLFVRKQVSNDNFTLPQYVSSH